jgi:hypothetical protein
MLASQRGRTGKDPSPDLVPRPPSPLGEGCGLLGAPPHSSMISLSLGERGDRKAVGEGSLPNARHASRNLLPELSNFFCLPGRAGGLPPWLAQTYNLQKLLAPGRGRPHLAAFPVGHCVMLFMDFHSFL